MIKLSMKRDFYPFSKKNLDIDEQIIHLLQFLISF